MSENKFKSKEESKKKLKDKENPKDKLMKQILNKNKKEKKKISMDNPQVYKEETLKSISRQIKEKQDILNKLELNINTLYEKAKNKLKEGDKNITKSILIKIYKTNKKISSICSNLDILEAEKFKYETEDINKIINEIKKREMDIKKGKILINPGFNPSCFDINEIKEEMELLYILSDEVTDSIDYDDEEQKKWVEDELISLEEEIKIANK